MGLWKKTGVNLILIVLGCLASVLVLELALRWSNPFHFRVRLEKIELLTNIKFKTKNTDIKKLDPVIVHTKNSLGFRGADPPRDFDRWLTIITVGGSTTECFYLSDGKTWTDDLGRELSRGFSRLWINNAGLDGHSTFGHLQLLKEYLLKLKPKCVLFLVGINDVGRDDLAVYDQGAAGLNIIEPRRSLMTTLAQHSAFFSLVLNFSRYFDGYRRGLVHHQVDLERLAKQEQVDPGHAARLTQLHRSKYLTPYAHRLTALLTACRDQGIEPVLLTQPALYGPARDPATGVNLGTIKVGQDNGSMAWDILELYNDVTRGVARREQVPLIDLARELPKDSRYFYDFFHFTNAGAARAGEIIYGDLAPVLARRFPEYVVSKR
jgi:lysophospholipase L1-like esterase